MSITSQDGVDRHKTGVFPVLEANYTNIQCQATLFAISWLTVFLCFVVITFIVCIIQEFIFVLNFTSYSTKSRTLENNLMQINDCKSWFKLPYKDGHTPDDWQRVTDDIYIYSAYWDTRISNESFVRIIGGATISKANLSATKCLVKYNYSSTLLQITADHEILTEHHNKPSRAVYFKCNITADLRPDYVSVVPESWNETWSTVLSWLTVHNFNNNTLDSNIGVCVRPMFNFTDIFRVAEFIAYYEALGVSQFSFYVYEAMKNITDFLKELKRNKYTIDVLPWSLPSQLDTMWEVGQLASINDCIYRQMMDVAYTVIVDFDEFVTPRHLMTLQEVLIKQDIAKMNFGSFVFRSCLFCDEYELDVLPPVVLPFITQSRVHRQNFIYPFKIRSKYIVKSLVVDVAGIHFVWRFVPGWSQHCVSASQVLVHHYRSSLCMTSNKTLEKGEIDVKSRKYLNQLMRSKVIEIWQNMFLN